VTVAELVQGVALAVPTGLGLGTLLLAVAFWGGSD
jgi:hypothetical protein